MNEKKIKVLLIEDIPQDIELVREMLSGDDNIKFEIDDVGTLSEGLKNLLNKKYDVILLDLGLPGSQELETLRKMKSHAPKLPIIIILTALRDEVAAQKSIQEGAQDYLIKGEVNRPLLKRSILYAIERKKMEESIQKESKFLNKILESLPHPFYVINADDYTIKMANSVACLGNLSKESTCYAITHRRDKPCTGEHVCPLEEVKKTKKPVIVEHIHYDKNGNARNVEVHGYPILDENGNVTQMIEYSLDITKRKKAEEKIMHAAEEWRRTFDAISDLIFIVDKDFRITRMNRAVKEVLKAEYKDILGKKCHELLHKADKPWPNCPCVSTKEDKCPHTEEVNDPNIGVPLLISTSPILDNNGELIGSVHIAKDISEQKEMEEDLKRNLADLQQFKQVTIDRENKMIELKKEINKMSKELGKPEPYDLSFL